MILKLIKYSLTMLLCCITLISCGQENISTNKPDIGKKENYSTGTPDIIENSSLPTQTPKKSKGRNKSKRGELQAIYGKWKILDMVGYGYIYGEFSMKDYVGGTVTIRENYIYKLEKQNEEDFWEYSHANIHSGFGFKSEKIKAVTVFDDKDEWDEFGNIFWIRDKDHLIIFGPVYFLAKRIE